MLLQTIVLKISHQVDEVEVILSTVTATDFVAAVVTGSFNMATKTNTISCI